MSGELGVGDPVLSCRRKTPKRFETKVGEGDFPEDVDTRYRQIFYEALDLITFAIESRFQQPGYKVYCHLEDVLVKAANKDNYEEDLTSSLSGFYKKDFNQEQLKMRWPVTFQMNNLSMTFSQFCSILGNFLTRREAYCPKFAPLHSFF